MGRRKKEPRSAHREHIADAAQALFMANGIKATSIDDIAKAAGYSKATVYVYFENKEEIVGVLVLESMKKLGEYLSAALEQEGTTREKYDRLCYGLVRYQEEFPFYFDMAISKINIDFESEAALPEEQETYNVGESINEMLCRFIADGMEKGDMRADIQLLPTIFTFWSMLSGFIVASINKQDYIEQAMGMSKQAFLAQGFTTLYRSIATAT